MDQSSDEDVIVVLTSTDHSNGEVQTTYKRYHPSRIVETSKNRMAICNGCDHLNGIKTCSLCKCFMPAKVAIPFAACPDGKWKEEV